MSRQLLSRLFATLLVFALVLPPTMAHAEDPSGKSAQHPLKPTGMVDPSTMKADPSAAVKAAVSLRESLSSEQLSAIHDVLARYEPEIVALNKGLPPVRDGNIAKLGGEPDMKTAQADLQAVRQVSVRLKAVQDKINADLAKVLSPEQYAQFQKGLEPANARLKAAESHASAANTSKDPSATDYTSSYCYTSGYYASITSYYSWYGYVYAYYNYYYSSTRTSYSYYNLYYSDYAYQYTAVGMAEVAAGYFDLVAQSSNFNGYLDDGVVDLYYGWYFQYYGYYYGYLDYTSGNGSGYANASYAYGYYSYYYNYNIAYPYAYYCYNT